jgi:hypothetical protein
MKPIKPVLFATLAAGLAAALAACGSSGSGAKKPPANSAARSSSAAPASTASGSAAAATTAPSSPTSSKPAAALGSGACKYVTTAQAAALAGSAVKPGVATQISTPPVTFRYCTYTFSPGNAPGVLVAVANLGSNGKSLFAQFRASKQADDVVPVSGVGDEAFYASENLNVRKGNTGVILFVGRANGSPRAEAGIPDEKKLAALVLPQL